jgi:hypothetical protein
VSARRREHRGRHEPLVITIKVPGQKLTLGRAEGAVIMRALADAEGYRQMRASRWCAKCEAAPAGACAEHVDDVGLVDVYRDLTDRLAEVLPLPESGAAR